MLMRVDVLERYGTVAAIAVCLCSLAASGVVLFGHAPPLFNAGMRIHHLVTLASVVVLIALVGILGASFLNARALRFRRPILLGLVVLGTVELILPVFDRLLVSTPGSPVSAATYTVHVPGGVFYLAQPNAQSAFGFRTPTVQPRTFAGRRILMLGNSFVVGSGTAFATNYPQVLERSLNDVSGTPVSVMSAGVNGFGPVEDRLLYQYLVSQGYHFDVVILNFYLGGDQTNDIADTTRTALAGRPQRLHTNFLLRHFYVLNTDIYRFAVALAAASGQQGWNESGDLHQNATCVESAAFQAFSMERAAASYSPLARRSTDMPYVRGAIRALAEDVKQNRANFGVVLLPDVSAALQNNRDHFKPGTMDWTWLREDFRRNIAGSYPVVDLSPVYQDRPDYFRCNDTHWNNRGNVRGGEVVADFVRQSLFAQRK